MPEITFLSNKAQKTTSEGCCSTKNPPTLFPSTKANQERRCLSCTCATSGSANCVSKYSGFLQFGLTAMTQARDLSGRRHPNGAAFIYISVTTSYSSAGTDGHHALQSFSLCKSTINLLYNIDVMDFVNTQPTNNDLLHELLAVQHKTRRLPHAQPSPVAASPTDLSRGKHTHTSVRPTCYTSKPKNNSSCL